MNIQANDKIAILYLSVGSGHQIAAETVGIAFGEFCSSDMVYVADPFQSVMPAALLGRLQRISIRSLSRFYEWAWHNQAVGSWINRLASLWFMQQILLRELLKADAGIVVATHALPCAVAVHLKRSQKQVKKVYAVVTDFGLHRSWPWQCVDRYFVGSEEIRADLIRLGVNIEQISVTGIPIRAGFQALPQSKVFSSGDVALKVLVIMSGLRDHSYAVATDILVEMLEKVRDLEPDQVRLTVVTGHNTRLFNQLSATAGENVVVLGYVDNMQELMGAHDVLVTKPGGLLMAEALAMGMASILVGVGPGQETANRKFLTEQGVAFSAQTALDIIQLFEKIRREPSILQGMKNRARRLGYPGATIAIASQIHEDLLNSHQRLKAGLVPH
ncbi:MAG: glycosyltransferase [Ardenticatenales bacterium]|nr:glycosyltransferase [Ardenticatenales bacterium]